MTQFFPNHPGFVHFPLGLLVGAFFFELVALVFRRPALHDVGRACLFLGTAAALVAVATGLWGERLVEPKPPALDALVDRHETLAFVTASLAVVLSMWRVAMRKSYAGGRRVAFVAGLAVLAAAVLYTGHVGGKMVYDHGAAVTVGQRSFAPHRAPAPAPPAKP